MPHIKHAPFFMALIFTVASVGCTINPGLPLGGTPSTGEAIVFGNIQLAWYGEPLKIDPFWTGPVWLNFWSAGPASSRYKTTLPGGDGTFYLHLPPGAYHHVTLDWRVTNGADTWRMGATLPDFIVNQPNTAVYIGTVSAEHTGTPSHQSPQLLDQFKAQSARFKIDFPNSTYPIVDGRVKP